MPNTALDNTFEAEFEAPEHAFAVLRAIENAGFEAWLVGGFVRDAIMGRTATDVDIATNAQWQDVKSICESHGMQTREIGVKHGTLTVIPNSENIETDGAPTNKAVEVTTYRCDGSYSDSRHPDEVKFVGSIEEDLARRDFTINAIAWHPERGLLDPLGGLPDINSGIIRIIGNASARFSEDALRILRACRFCSQLGFSIEPASFEAMVSHKCLLSRVSTERITHELDCLLLGEHAGRALIECADVLEFVLPEICAMRGCEQRTPYHIYDVYEHTVATVEAAPRERLVRWAALCHDMGKPAAAFFGEDGREHFYGHAKVGARITKGLADRLLMSNAFKTDLVALVRAHDDVIEPTARSVRRALARMDGRVELFSSLLALKRADISAHAPKYATETWKIDRIEHALEEVLAAEDAFTLKKLAISGEDVMALGVPEGPRIGELLQAALELVIDGEMPNERETLENWVREQL